MADAKKTQKKEKQNKKTNKTKVSSEKTSVKATKKVNKNTAKTPPVSVKAEVPVSKKTKKNTPKKSAVSAKSKEITKKSSKKSENKNDIVTLESKSKTSKSSNLEKTKTNQKFYDQLKLSESYVSLILGGIVVIGISVLFLFFLREARNPSIPKPEVLNTSVSPVLTKAPQQTYIMGENETLWDVAVKFYGDGFAYPRIIEANKDKIENADFVPPGTVIIIPDAK